MDYQQKYSMCPAQPHPQPTNTTATRTIKQELDDESIQQVNLPIQTFIKSEPQYGEFNISEDKVPMSEEDTTFLPLELQWSDEEDSRSSKTSTDIIVNPKNVQTLNYIRLQWNCPFDTDCHEHFDSKEAFDAHMLKAHGCLAHRCQVAGCTASFTYPVEVGIHSKEVHSEMTNFPCSKDKCNKTFRDYARLSNHVYQVHSYGLYRCNYGDCQQLFTSANSIRNHSHQHQTTTCSHCGKQVSFQHLKQHMRRHSLLKMKPMCDTCGREFTKNSSLKDHARVHSGEKLFTCSICGAFFATKSQMTSHLNRHQEASIKCPHCPKMFAVQASMRKHVRRSHNLSHKSK